LLAIEKKIGAHMEWHGQDIKRKQTKAFAIEEPPGQIDDA